MKRWMRFNAIGMMGALVQLLALRVLLSTGMHYLVATALAVELAMLNNYFWHLKWTWTDRSFQGRVRAFVRLHVANGTVSIISNVLLMRLLAGQLHFPPLPANLIAITSMSVVNFMLGDRWVFREQLTKPV